MSDRNGGIPDPIVWLGCVLTAVAVSVLIQSLRTATPRDASEESLAMRRALDQTDRIVEQLDRLDERIRSLEDGASRGSATPLGARSGAAAVPDELHAAALAELDDRLADLENRATQREKREADEQAARHAQEQAAREQLELAHHQRQLLDRENAYAIILDPETTDSQKAQAWQQYSRSGENPWTDDILSTMIDIAASSEDARARELVWIGADTPHQRSDRLVQPLIQALEDPVANVREEAADALRYYLDYPGVYDALQWSGEHDASDKVRAEARRVLAGEDTP